MVRKVLIDCDMGIDDAVALCMLLFDSRLEVVALTACEGCVNASQANDNLQAVVGELDPGRYPRLGVASPAENAPPVNSSWLYGDDGLGNSCLRVSSKQHLLPAEKVIIDAVRSSPGDVTILCLGPLTNLARAIRRDPSIISMINRVVMVGGAITAPGNITPMAEFNFYFDPASAREVFRAPLARTLVPLDVTTKVTFGLDMIPELPAESTRSGSLLHQMLPHAFRSFRRHLGRETITLNDAAGALALSETELFEFEDMSCDIEVDGELTRGVTVFDRRQVRDERNNVEVAIDIDADRARQMLLDFLVLSGNSTGR